MTKTTKSKQPEILTGRIISNNGATALLQLTDDAVVEIYRGHSPSFEDIFAEDFLRILSVGQLFKCSVRADSAVWLLGTTQGAPSFSEFGPSVTR